jgi:glutathione S-transferase
VFQFLLPTLLGKPVNEKEVAKRLKYMEVTLDKLENDWLQDRPYLVGDTITIADILGACEVEQPRMFEYINFKTYC